MKQDIEINSLALKTRKDFGEDAYSPIDIFAMVNGWNNLTIVYYPMSNRISGMCTKVNDNTIICINSETSYGRQRFTLAHEIYHIMYEQNKQRIICDMSLYGDKSESEKEADRFASYLLVPYDALKQYFERIALIDWSINDVIKAEQYFQISHKAMLVRLLQEKYITQIQFEEYQNVRIKLFAEKLGYSDAIYSKSSENRKYYTTGEYIKKIENLAERNLISQGKREEMLMDAYRADIVYNLSEEGMDIND